jgi:hypothetical protein
MSKIIPRMGWHGDATGGIIRALLVVAAEVEDELRNSLRKVGAVADGSKAAGDDKIRRESSINRGWRGSASYR